MICIPCDEAAKNAASYKFTKNCRACDERHFAHLPIFWESVRARDFTTAYKDALDKQFGEAGAQDAHDNIKAWFKRINLARNSAAQNLARRI